MRLLCRLFILGYISGVAASALAAPAALTDKQAQSLAQQALAGDAESLTSLETHAAAKEPAAEFGLSAYYYASDDKTQSMQWLRKSAQHGFPQAEYNLAMLYKVGQGVPLDAASSLMWFKRAAAQGLLKAQVAVGLDYLNGTGVTQDYSEAAAWFQKAADREDPGAEYALGRLYYDGQGLPQDYAKAFAWLQKAADQGETGAEAHLCNDYAIGAGVPVDFVTAYRWCSIALSLADPASDAYDVSRKVIATIGPSMSPKQIAEAQSLAGDWMHDFDSRKHP